MTGSGQCLTKSTEFGFLQNYALLAGLVGFKSTEQELSKISAAKVSFFTWFILQIPWETQYKVL